MTRFALFSKRSANLKLKIASTFALLASLLSLGACGGGGSGGGTSPPPPPPPASTWQQGVFQPSGTFAARCEVPRSGIDPDTGQPYPDVQGAVLDENNFLRSYSDETYLWYDEIIDRDPGGFNDPLVYFDLLKTTETTPSGKDKDPDGFHFAVDTEEWRLGQQGISVGYGVDVIFLSAIPPREAVVVLTQPNTPATAPGVDIQRGARILTVDGVDLVNDNTQAGVDVLNAALFPTNGDPHTFEILDLGAANTREVTIAPIQITETFVQEVSVIDTPTGAVGYMLFTSHRGPAEELLVDAVNLYNAHNGGQGIDDLVLDLRYNTGGNVFLAAQVAYMIAGSANTAGRTFEVSQFSDKHPTTNPVTGEPITPTPFFDFTFGWQDLIPNQPLPSLNLSRVFILTGTNTCSASDAIMNGLRGIDIEVIQIGSITCGKPFGFYGTDNCGNTYFTIQLKGVNEKGFGEYEDGFKAANSNEPFGVALPGCSIPDDFDKLLGDPEEARLAAALQYRDFQTCPAPPPFGISSIVSSKTTVTSAEFDGYLHKSFYDSNRMYELPERTR